jgi:hypothetical protein
MGGRGLVWSLLLRVWSYCCFTRKNTRKNSVGMTDILANETKFSKANLFVGFRKKNTRKNSVGMTDILANETKFSKANLFVGFRFN